MRLSNEFEVAADVDRTWSILLDVPRVARALPGAAIEPDAGDGAWRGTMKVRLGPVTTEYAGTARLADVDEDERVASFHVQGREARGQGMAAATIVSRVAPANGGTRVILETDLQVSGRQAQLGRGLMEDVAAAILAEFAARLERELRGEPAADAGDGAADALDVGSAMYGPLLERAALVLAGVAVGLVVGRGVWRR